MRSRATAVAAAAALTIGLSPLRAQETRDALPATLQIGLILKALTYDRTLVERAGEELTIGVVYVAGDPVSVQAKNEMADTLKAFAGKTVKKVPIRFVVLEYTTPGELERAVKASQVEVLYVAPGNAGHLPAVLKLSQSQRIITTTGVPDYVRRGVAVGVGLKQDKPEVLINLRSSRSEGSEFDSRLLRSATVL
jgi:hypothetical protein